jgi:LL-diaminopimelate aminotransferase
MKTNHNYDKLEGSYLFSKIAQKVREHQNQHPEAKIIRMGIGDVTMPLCDAVLSAMHSAVSDMGAIHTFRGYGPEQGYSFLQLAIRDYYAQRNIELDEKEIFISDGAKSDLGNILDLVDLDNRVLVPDPVYPVYVDTNVMAGRVIQFMNATEENGFLPLPDPSVKADVIYLCSPNNPTGAVFTREQLTQWVDYAREQGALILFDAAYEAFIRDPELPRSIYEIPGAKECAIEFCSFSKTAGFTGVRCGYTIVPRTLKADSADLNRMWTRRQTTKFNGVSYISQRAAEAIFQPEGMRQVKTNIDYYLGNAAVMMDALDALDIPYVGGANSPYIWLKCPDQMDSWSFFDLLLKEANLVVTPGAGFGKNGEGFCRLTSFNTRENTVEAMARVKQIL